ncbi:MAG: hypothetical protein RSC68_19255, partial [Acinetobacter sp.]
NSGSKSLDNMRVEIITNSIGVGWNGSNWDNNNNYGATSFNGSIESYLSPAQLRIRQSNISIKYLDEIKINTYEDEAQITLVERVDTVNTVPVSITPVTTLLSGDPNSVFITKNGQPGCSELLVGERCELNVDTGKLALGSQATGYVNLTLKVK